MKRESLKGDKRTIAGKKVRKLRREGILPANIYGKEFKSTSVQLPIKDFLNVFNIVHETGLVDIAFDSQIIPVLIHNVQIDPRSQNPVHADFFKVNLKEKITARVPVVAVGEAKAVLDKVGLLEQPVAELVTKEMEEEIAAAEAEAAAAAEAQAETAPAEGEVPAEGEAPAEGETPTEAPVAQTEGKPKPEGAVPEGSARREKPTEA